MEVALQGYPHLQSEFDANLSYVKIYQRRNKTEL